MRGSRRVNCSGSLRQKRDSSARNRCSVVCAFGAERGAAALCLAELLAQQGDFAGAQAAFAESAQQVPQSDLNAPFARDAYLGSVALAGGLAAAAGVRVGGSAPPNPTLTLKTSRERTSQSARETSTAEAASHPLATRPLLSTSLDSRVFDLLPPQTSTTRTLSSASSHRMCRP